ncbi:pyrroline-5-carboxylate reductase [Kordiimonas marina]|uniref:pyrroline-5-carboxylate reductase n=1 Tax=Kordiimonas marina TaxID=2872312 RepID=UPI001FF33981|nr:pyrroline-5-carboxylate reductase [Kordiimonas marina]MCJ9429699.1 pyrroline-5-carboxylate reductase [Kordiimonas marina]
MHDGFDTHHPLILVGCGNMGRAMAEGWLKAGHPADALYVVDPAAGPDVLPGVPADHFVTSADALPAGLTARALVLAVKPQVMDDALKPLGAFTVPETLVISVAAGITVARLEKGLGVSARFVRAMPNTPAAVGAGITGLAPAPNVAADDRAVAGRLLSAIGQVVWLDHEDQINSVTAVSGSGPAYVFYMVECMAAAGVAEGLEADVAMKLARQTIIGAAHLMEAQPDVPAAELRRRVTSPGGTTKAALDILMRDEAGLAALMAEAMHAARTRGEELAG